MKANLIILVFSICSFVFFRANAQWIQTNGPVGETVNALTISGANIFAGTNNGVFLSTNNGDNWTSVNNGITNNTITSFAINGTNLFAGTTGGIFLSSDIGANWIAVNNGLAVTFIYSMAISDTTIYAGSDFGGGVFVSNNNGVNWTTEGGIGVIYSLAAKDSTVYAGSISQVYKSVDNGGNFLQTGNFGPPSTNIWALALIGNKVIAGTNGYGVRISNNGGSWLPASNGLPTNSVVNALLVSGNNIFAGTNQGVFLSTDTAANWTSVNTGLTDTVLSFATNGTDIYAGTNGSGVFKTSLSEILGVETINNLDFNIYPNPANTKIKIYAKTSIDNIRIYDTQGNFMPQNTIYEGDIIEIDISSFTNGIYFIYAETKEGMLLNKMVKN